MKCEQEKSELAVYALAALDTEETQRVGRHLHECAACSADLDDIQKMMTAVSVVTEEDLLGDWTGKIPELREAAVRAAAAERAITPPLPSTASVSGSVPPPTAVPPLTVVPPAAPAARTSPGRFRGRNWALAAALVGVMLGFGTATLTQQSGTDTVTATALTPPTGPDTLRATSGTGIRAAVQPRSTGWGTEVLLELTGIDGPRRCTLVAVSDTGTEETALTWQVPPKGYGLPGSAKKQLLAVGGTATPSDKITEYIVRTTDGRTLVTIPASPRTT